MELVFLYIDMTNILDGTDKGFPSNENDVEPEGSIYDRPRDPPGQRSVYIPPGDTFKESYRLSTFIRFPSDTPVNPRLLSSSGFFFTGYKDRVKCFSCGLCVENWVIGDDVTSSRWHRENCAMMLEEDSGNIPIDRLFPFYDLPPRRNPGRSSSENRTSNSTGNASSPNVVTTSSASLIGNNTASAGSLLQNEPRSPSVPTTAASLRQTARPVRSAPPRQENENLPGIDLATIPSVHHEQFIRSLNLRRESDRLRTFDSWPSTNQTVHPPDLARFGFFYLGNLDRVQCFSCGGVLRNWNYGDNVEREHKTHFPDCRLMRGNETQNIALSAGDRPPVPRPIVMQEPPDPSEAEQRDLENMFPCLMPASAHMRNEDSRFDTFDERWPASQIRASPRQIAKAGFFFLGDRDRVKCWYCNGGLQNWDPDDEPWTEHAKWFPTCEFLLQRKGPDFVHRIVALFPNLPRPVLHGPYDVPPRNRGPPRPPSPPPRIIDPRVEMQRVQEQVNEAMSSPLVETAAQMGFEERHIRRAIQGKFQRDNEMYSTVASLIEDLTAHSMSDGDSVASSQMSLDPREPANAEPQDVPESSSKRSENNSGPASKTRGANANEETANLMDTEYSMPEGVSPSMEARIRELQDERKCKICLDKIADVVFVPCGHLCSCTSCAEALRKCPICRLKIEKSIRTYMT